MSNNNIINYNVDNDNQIIASKFIIYLVIYLFICRIIYIIYKIFKPERNTLHVTLLTNKLVESDLNSVKECCICLEDNSLEQSIKLNCNHIFHKECIKKWYNEVKTNYQYKLNFNCPLCKTIII